MLTHSPENPVSPLDVVSMLAKHDAQLHALTTQMDTMVSYIQQLEQALQGFSNYRQQPVYVPPMEPSA